MTYAVGLTITDKLLVPGAPAGPTNRVRNVLWAAGQVGRHFTAIRRYKLVNSMPMDPEDKALLDACDGGMILTLNTDDGVPWTKVTSGAYDASIKEWAIALKAAQGAGKRIWLGWAHEPTNPDTNRGTPIEYIAAYRHFVTVCRANGFGGPFVWTPMMYRFSTHQVPYYPGDAYVDVIGPDGYNWQGVHTASDCIAMKSFSSIFQEAATFAKSHRKRFGVGETGCAHRTDTTKGGPNYQATWVRAMTKTVEAWDISPGVDYIAYFYNPATINGTFVARCDWTMKTDAAKAAMKDFIVAGLT